MSKIHPYFEINGNRYEFKRNRHLIAILDEIRREAKATDEEQRQYTKLLELQGKVERLAERKAEIEEEYYVDFDEENGELLEKCETAYNKAVSEYIEYEIATGITDKMQKDTLQNAEKFILQALQVGKDGDEVMSANEAEKVWCAYVDEVGEQVASQFLLLTVNYISGADEETDNNDFFTQAKVKAEQRAANRRAGLKRVK